MISLRETADDHFCSFRYREHYLEKIAIYLSRCGLQSNSELIEKGYPDLGWDPVEGERYLDFLRFCVWVNGKVRVWVKLRDVSRCRLMHRIRVS